MVLTRRVLIVLLIAAMAGIQTPIVAQGTTGAGLGFGLHGFGPRLGQNIDLALELRDRLDLTNEQIRALEELRGSVEREVSPLEAEIRELRNRVIVGEMDWATGVADLQDLFVRYDAVAEPFRTGVISILTSDQHLALQNVMLETRLEAAWDAGAVGRGAGLQSMPPGVQGLWRGPAPGLGGGLYLGRGGGLGLGRAGARGLGRGLGLGRPGARGLGFGRAGTRGLGRGLGVGRGLGPGRAGGLSLGQGLGRG